MIVLYIYRKPYDFMKILVLAFNWYNGRTSIHNITKSMLRHKNTQRPCYAISRKAVYNDIIPFPPKYSPSKTLKHISLAHTWSDTKPYERFHLQTSNSYEHTIRMNTRVHIQAF